MQTSDSPDYPGGTGARRKVRNGLGLGLEQVLETGVVADCTQV